MTLFDTNKELFLLTQKYYPPLFLHLYVILPALPTFFPIRPSPNIRGNRPAPRKSEPPRRAAPSSRAQVAERAKRAPVDRGRAGGAGGGGGRDGRAVNKRDEKVHIV